MKPRKSKLDPYADEIAAWYRDEPALTLADCCARLRQRGCSVSPANLSAYLAARRAEDLRAKVLGGIATGSAMARQIDAAFAKHPPAELQTLIGLVKNLTLTLTVQGQTDPALLELANVMLKSVLEFAKLEAKQQDTRLAERRVVVLERQFEQAKSTLADPALSDADKQARMRQLFGIS